MHIMLHITIAGTKSQMFTTTSALLSGNNEKQCSFGQKQAILCRRSNLPVNTPEKQCRHCLHNNFQYLNVIAVCNSY